MDKIKFDINYPMVTAVVIVVALLIFFIVRKNQKDEKEFENEIEASELKPNKHKNKELK